MLDLGLDTCVRALSSLCTTTRTPGTVDNSLVVPRLTEFEEVIDGLLFMAGYQKLQAEQALPRSKEVLDLLKREISQARGSISSLSAAGLESDWPPNPSSACLFNFNSLDVSPLTSSSHTFASSAATPSTGSDASRYGISGEDSVLFSSSLELLVDQTAPAEISEEVNPMNFLPESWAP